MTSSFSLNPVAVEAAAKAIADLTENPTDDQIAEALEHGTWEAHLAEAAIRAFLEAEGAEEERRNPTRRYHEREPLRRDEARIVTELEGALMGSETRQAGSKRTKKRRRAAWRACCYLCEKSLPGRRVERAKQRREWKAEARG